MFKATLNRIIFEKPQADGGYYYVAAVTIHYNKPATITGTSLEKLSKDQEIEFDGEWIDTKYGKQLKCNLIKTTAPKTADGLLKYMLAGNIKGIGKKTAEKVITAFGNKIFDILENTPEKLAGVIPKDKAQLIIDDFLTHTKAQDALMFLMGYGIGQARALKIYKLYGDNTVDTVRTNPYKLIEDVDGIGFTIADNIALNLGIKFESEYRIQAAIKHVLTTNENEGSTCLEKPHLTLKLADLNVTNSDLIASIVDYMLDNEIIYQLDFEGENYLYSKSMYVAEIASAKVITELLNNPQKDVKFDFDANTTLTDEQLDAVKTALSSNVSVITGSAGVGKSTVVKEIIKQLRHNGLSFSLCAPTGRAAKRITESTNEPASTIHRLIGYGGEPMRIDTDYVIVDESSMIDQRLLCSLLLNVHPQCSIVFIGDSNQLESVGAGLVLWEMINSGTIPVARLTKIFRQAGTSDIVLHSHSINDGIMPTFKDSDTDFYFYTFDWTKGDTEKNERVYLAILDNIKNLFTDIRKLGYDPIMDTQVIAPMKKGTLGTKNLNEYLQGVLNPVYNDSSKMQHGNRTFCEGDKVIQTKNNYDKNVFNGNVGYIHTLDKDEGCITVDFDGYKVEYLYQDLEQLDLAYAITIHKSQGSEYPVLIMPIVTAHYAMLQRNLLYTGVTRGKKLVYLLGHEMAVRKAISTTKSSDRVTNFGRLICEK